MAKLIPTRARIQEQISDYYDFPRPNITLEQYISEWLETLDLPETITIFNEPVNPKDRILSDLDSYVKQSNPNI